MVNILIRKENNGVWIRGLAIPLEDIQRFSRRPLKWLRFVAFAVLGAKGDLFDAPNGNIVNYDTVSVTNADSYYFFPDGRYHLVDSNALADKITASTASTPRRHHFCNEVARRDNNHCVITGVADDDCHAAHIIPHSKGDQNGIFLFTGLHGRFGRGAKTPNFALQPNDIHRVEPGDMPASRTTIQHIEPWEGWSPIPQWDVRANWAVQDAPPSILLDYVYGVAIVLRWATSDILDLLEECQETYYKDDGDAELENPTDSTYVPPRGTVYQHGTHQTRTESAQCRAIDTAFAFTMFFKGYPPRTTIDMILQKQEEEAEIRSRQVAKEKVQGWLETSELFPLSHGSDRGGD
ncbi:hypothetical protein EV363DRAFT_1540456 [Boletus edulis]|nr:hypothetical protein EV363DRAFT_1540456 [Boletus edulis]